MSECYCRYLVSVCRVCVCVCVRQYVTWCWAWVDEDGAGVTWHVTARQSAAAAVEWHARRAWLWRPASDSIARAASYYWLPGVNLLKSTCWMEFKPSAICSEITQVKPCISYVQCLIYKAKAITFFCTASQCKSRSDHYSFQIANWFGSTLCSLTFFALPTMSICCCMTTDLKLELEPRPNICSL